jgi:hypothetical protein
MIVSYCITCKNRIGHLQQTLRANLDAEADDPMVEFVLLNYQSEDGLAEWIQTNFAAEIASGRLVHAYHTPAPFFRMAHAKNLAHRIAGGEILCNLDADNFLPRGYAQMVRKAFAGAKDRILVARRPNSLLMVLDRLDRRFLRLRSQPSGLGGRIALPRDLFTRLGGYDEALSAWGGDDLDITVRARDAGARVLTIPQAMWGKVIQHENETRVSNLSAADKAVSKTRMSRTFLTELQEFRRAVSKRHDSLANQGSGFGQGHVVINFGLREQDFH